MAGILHDVVDDTCESLHSIEEMFGDDVAKLVAGVSRISYINQVINCLPLCAFNLRMIIFFSYLRIGIV